MRFGVLAMAVAMGWLSGAAPASAATPATLTATRPCPAWQSIHSHANPGAQTLVVGRRYPVLAGNRPQPSFWQVRIDGAQPAARWVAVACGTTDSTPAPAPAPAAPPPAGGNSGGMLATHLLALSWEPNFCATMAQKAECRAMTATSPDARHLSLHGLWPEPNGRFYCGVAPALQQADGNRQWDQLPAPDLAPATRAALAAVMPGTQSGLERHEWIKHGTCFGTSADAYFARAAGLVNAINRSAVDALVGRDAGGQLSAAALRTAFDAAFGAGAGARVQMKCNNGVVTEIDLWLAGDVAGSAPLGDLLRAARPYPAGCAGGRLGRVGG